MRTNSTDYEFPEGWHNMTSDEKHIWFSQERCMRQALRQKTPSAQDIKDNMEKQERLSKSHPDTVDLSEWQ